MLNQVPRHEVVPYTKLDTMPWRRGNEGTRVYPKVSGLPAWGENCKWYSSLPPGAVLLLFY